MGNWLEPNDYDQNAICQLCDKVLGTERAVYKTHCGHIFHNNCLLMQICKKKVNPNCPISHEFLGDDCSDVSKFFTHTLTDDFANLPAHLQDIYTRPLRLTLNSRSSRKTVRNYPTEKSIRSGGKQPAKRRTTNKNRKNQKNSRR